MLLLGNELPSAKARVTSEDLLHDVFTRYTYPKKRLCRVYAPGIDPVEPNPFKYAFVASIQESGQCEIKALASDDDPKSAKRITKGDLVAACMHLQCFGAKILHWRHDMEEHVFKLSAPELSPNPS